MEFRVITIINIYLKLTVKYNCVAKVILAITRQKKKLRKVKYISLRLGRDAFAYPPLAKNAIKSAGISDLWLLDSEVADDKLEQRNIKYLMGKTLHIHLDDRSYATSAYDELCVLGDWLMHGVHDSERDEFMQRSMHLRHEIEPIAHYMFDTKVKEQVFQLFVGLKSAKRSETVFEHKHRNFRVVQKERSKQFRDEIMEILRKPRELEEIVKLTKANESNARRWLSRLESQGIVVKTRKRMGIGRPKNIYYLSQRLRVNKE